MKTSVLDNHGKKSSVINMRILVWPLTRVLAVFAAFLVTVALLAVPQQWSSTPEASAQQPQPSTERCGASVAFVVDLSNSLARTEVEDLKDTVGDIVTNLQGAPYNIGLYTFGTNSPFGTLTNVTSASLRTQEGINELNTAIDALYNLPDSNDPIGGTNWEGGLEAVANDMATGADYDVVYFITDGQPTYDNDGEHRSGGSTESVEVNSAITQKDRIASMGGRVIPVGVGLSPNMNIYDSGYERRTGWWPFYNYEWVWSETGSDYQIRERNVSARNLLGRITTAGESPIIVDSYDTLADDLTANFATGCVQIVKEIVDAEGNVIDTPNVGNWNFSLTNWQNVPGTSTAPTSATTDATGTAEISVEGMVPTRPASVTISEVADTGGSHELRQQNGANARCVSYKAGDAPQEVSAPNSGATGVRVELDAESIIACTFQNQASAPLTLEKRVQINNTQLQQELNSRTYDFNYQCIAGGTAVASGTASIAANSPLVVEESVPVGSECTVTEAAPDTDPGRFDVTTSWASQYVTGASTSTDGLSHTFTVGEEAYVNSLGARAIATNTYDAESATISVRKSIPNREALPANSVPPAFTIRYSCRYVIDTNNPPEQSNDPTAPYYVAEGTVTVPGDGTPVQIVDDEVPGGFPVGTQCLYEEVSPITSPITIDGFDLTTSWNSDICLENSGDVSGDLNICAANYTWIPAAGDYTVEVVNDYQRQTGAAVISKELTGEAADSGVGQPFNFDVVCTQDGTTIFTESITVAGGGEYRLTGVPIGADCSVTEQETQIPGAVNDDLATADFRVTSRTEDARVTLTNDLSYLTESVTLNKVVDTTDVQDATTAIALEGAFYPVTATCNEPGQAAPTVVTEEVAGGAEVSFGPFRVGTTCTFTEELPEIEGIDHLAQFSPAILTVTEGTNEVNLTNTFWTAEGSLTIAKTVATDTSQVADLESFIPNQFTIDYICDGSSGSITLVDGESESVGPFPVGTTCTITEQGAEVPEAELDTTFTGPDGNPQQDQITGTITGTSGVVVNVTNSYTPAYASVELDKQVSVTRNGTEVDPALKNALIGADRRFSGSYECRRGNEVVASGALALDPANPTTVQVPVSADCDFWENDGGNTIASLDGPEVTYSGTPGMLTDGRYTLASVSGQNNPLVVNNAYQLQTGGFNLKKKVDGEGVATISSDRQYEINYVCTLQGQEVKNGTIRMGRFDDASEFQVRDVPVGSSCEVTETGGAGQYSAEEENAEWEARWTVAGGTTGWETEQSCDTASGCTTGAEQNVATIDILPSKPAWSTEEDYFQGTLVVWNTYTYDKVTLNVEKLLDGDGPDLADGDQFIFDLVCTDPNFSNSGLGDLPYVQDPTITQVVTIDGEGNLDAGTMVPIGYDCTITERQVNTYDATVTANFANPIDAGAVTTTSSDPAAVGGADAEFTVARGAADWETVVDEETQEATEQGTYHIDVTNAYERERAELTLTKTLEGGELAGNVNAYIDNPGSFDMTYRCEDPHRFEADGTTNVVYEGTVPVPTDGSAVAVSPVDEGGAAIDFPASVTCVVEEDVTGHVPEASADVVNASHNLAVTRGDQAVQLVSNTTVTNEFGLDAATATNVAFSNAYSVNQINLGFSKYIEGDPNAEVVDPATTPFTFEFTCTVNNLVGSQPVPEIDGSTGVIDNVVTGSFELVHGQSWSTGSLPVGSTCAIEEVPNAEFLQEVDDAGLRMSVNYVYPGADPQYEAPADGEEDQVAQPIVGDAVRIPLPDGEAVPLSGDNPYAWLLNSFFADEAEVQVHKINMGGDPLEGARFAIYPVDPDNPEQPGAAPIIDDMQFVPQGDAVDEAGNPVPDPTKFVAQLEPGTYYLVETKSGTDSELLPQPWRFSVAHLNADDPWSDLQFELSDYDQNSGLITVQNSTDGTSPAIIQVANVESGEMPLTGDRGVWWTVGAGALLLALAGLIYLRRRA